MTVAEGKAADGSEAGLLELAPLDSALHLVGMDRGGGGCMGFEEDTPNHCSVGASRLSGLTIKKAYLEDCSRVGAGASNVEAFLLQGVVSCETVR